MVVFLLFMKADLENVGSVSLRRSANLCVTVRNPLSDFEVREKVVFNPSETVDQDEGSREPEHHFSLTWEAAKKASTLTCLDEQQAKTMLKKSKGKQQQRLPRFEYKAEDSGEWVPLITVSCRGLEPTQFFPLGNDEFIVASTNGTEFTEDVDLSESDWADYDAEHDLSVSVSNVQFKWEAA
jgi:hypothetical protein